MSKSEKAIENYPIPHRRNYKSIQEFDEAVRKSDIGRIGFYRGYEEAEADLKLTWEDMIRISQIFDEIIDERTNKYDVGDPQEPMSDEEYGTEVLKRFYSEKQSKI